MVAEWAWWNSNREKEDTEIRLIRRPHADTQTDRQTDTHPARHRRRLVVNGWSVHAPQHIRFGTLEVCLQNAPGSLPSRSGLLRPREIGMQGGLTSVINNPNCNPNQKPKLFQNHFLVLICALNTSRESLTKLALELTDFFFN